MASLSNLRQDLSQLKPTSQTSGQNYRWSELPASLNINEDELDGQEVNSATNFGTEAAVDICPAGKIYPLDGCVESGLEARNSDHM